MYRTPPWDRNWVNTKAMDWDLGWGLVEAGVSFSQQSVAETEGGSPLQTEWVYEEGLLFNETDRFSKIYFNLKVH